MTSSATKIKKEFLDDSYNESDTATCATTTVPRCSSTTSSPSEADSRSSHDSCSRVAQPPSKRSRMCKRNEATVTQNGHSRCHQVPCVSPAYEHYEGGHASETLRELNENRLRKRYVDLVIAVDGKEIPCHKVVLCSVSEYFADRLANTTESPQQRIHVTEASADVMTQLVDFTYTSRIAVTDNNINQLLPAAIFFKFKSVKDACVAVLRQRMSPETCITIKRFASEQRCKDLADSAISFIQENFSDISKAEEFDDLTLDELISYVSSASLNVKREEIIFEAVMKWIRRDVSTRKQNLPKLLEHVRLPLVKPQFLLDVVQSDQLIKNNKECEVYLDEARRYQLLPDQRPLMQSSRTQPRLTYSFKKTEILVTVGGLDKEKSAVQDCTYFDFPDPVAKHLSPIKIGQTAYSVASVNSNIFITGGAYHKPFREVWMYVPSLNKWREVAPMNEPRYLHASVGFSKYLYVIGGHNGSDRLCSVEKYNPDSNIWHNSEPMLRKLSSPTAVTCDRLLYIIGGATGPSSNDIVCDVQCYDPKTDIWRLVSPLPRPERGAVAANLNGTIYVMGQKRSVLSYNRKDNVWVSLQSTIGGHLHGAATIHRGQLYVAGGLHGNSYINGTVEVYDAINDNWQVTTTLHVPVYAQGFVSIYKHETTSSEV